MASKFPLQLLSAQQNQAYFNTTTAIQDSRKDKKDASVIYYGPISSKIKNAKILSMWTSGLSLTLVPPISLLTSVESNVIFRGTIASSILFLSAITMWGIHWLSTPYIHKLTWQPGSDSFNVEMMTWMATYIPRTVKFSDIRSVVTKRPFVTFKANDDLYFVDKNGCQNKALLARIIPRIPDSALKNL